MITDAIMALGTWVLKVLVGWLPTANLDVGPWVAMAANAGTLFGCVVNVSALGALVTLVLTVEGGVLLVRSGGWLWSWIRG